MPLYLCNLCNISTNILSHHKRHLKTKKHLKNQNNYDNNLEMSINIAKMSKNEQKYTKNEHKMSKNEQIMSKNSKKKYNCEYCGNLFTTHANMMRHINHYCKVVKKEKEEKENLKLELVRVF